jgi:hypothetical protein
MNAAECEAPTPAASLPFGQDLAYDLDKIQERVMRGMASVIIIDGSLGAGKTTLAVEVADYIEGHPIVFEEQLSMGATEFTKKLGLCYKNHRRVVIYDEAGDFSRRGAMTRVNATINRVFEVFRAFKIIIILCLPNFSVLDNELFLKNVPRLLLHVCSRDKRSGRYRVYSLSRALVIRDKMTKTIVKSRAYDAVPFNSAARFQNLPPARCAELDAFSTKGKLAELWKATANLEGLATSKTLIMQLGVSRTTFFRVLREAGVTAAQRQGSDAYYNITQIKALFKRRGGGES